MIRKCLRAIGNPPHARGMLGGSGCHWELFGLSVTVFGLAWGRRPVRRKRGHYVRPGVAISGMGVIITFIAALVHSLA